MSDNERPVFGPGRPRAAHTAITELEQAEAAYQNRGSEAAGERLRRARAIRAHYYEYADAATALARL
jgi:hypothetical protein